MNHDNYQAAMNAPIQQQNSDNSDQGIEMLTKPWEWISDMFYAGIALLGWISFVVIVGIAAGYGLMKAGLI